MASKNPEHLSKLKSDYQKELDLQTESIQQQTEKQRKIIYNNNLQMQNLEMKQPGNFPYLPITYPHLDEKVRKQKDQLIQTEIELNNQI